MKLLQPINYCDAPNFLYRLPVQCSASDMLIPPLPLAYWSIYLRSCVCMPTLFSHLSKIWIDWYSASTRPASLQESTCAHVSTHWSQLEHVGSWCGLYRDWIRFVPAIFITCFHAHSWNNRGTSCNVSYTILQETSLKPSGVRIPSLTNSFFANCWWTQNCRLSPVLDVIFSFPTKIATGSSGNISWSGKCSPSIPQMMLFVW